MSELSGIINAVFKKVTQDNWAERDPINENFAACRASSACGK
ncbi:MAG TPA: hypothetical protein VK730_01530 [Solirubrobacteraceae bacterium]|jgi:hypothetical protein|nr:hypothetical protein [Solirubrobacteraceae bacterium]